MIASDLLRYRDGRGDDWADWQAEALGIAQAHVERANEPSWWALPDLAAARIRGPRAPKVLGSIMFDSDRPAPGLRPTVIGRRRLDLRNANLYASLIETRARKGVEDPRWDRFLKVVANSLYGITAEMNVQATIDGKVTDIEVDALRSYTALTALPEEPGRFFFAPIAALTTAGARLVLAVLERLVTDRGGAWCFADTDSMAIVASERGGLVPCPGGPRELPEGRDAVEALTWDEVDLIRARINELNPYDRSVIPELLKVEAVNHVGNDTSAPRRELWAWAISAKRYMLFARGPRGTEVGDRGDHRTGGRRTRGDRRAPTPRARPPGEPR